MYDILIKGGRVIDPSQELNDLRDVALQDGRITLLGEAINSSEARIVVDARGLLVVPGLVDIHVHVHWGVSHYGVDADESCLARGVTTAVDAGSAGGHTYPSLKRYVIDRARTRVYAFLNIAYPGMIGDEVGELEDMRFINKELALQVGRADEVIGIKARMDRVGQHPATEPLRSAIEVAGALDKPMMVHIGNAERMHVPLQAILDLMRPGDIVTHTYHGHHGGILAEDGQLRPEVLLARERGILFDVGHGAGSFTFDTARKAIDQGFVPDTISSDLHTQSIGGPVYDLPTTMSKFLHLGMSLEDIVERATWAPAQALGLGERIGTLKPGAEGDVCLLELQGGRFSLRDCARETVVASKRLSVERVVRGGELVQADQDLAATLDA